VHGPVWRLAAFSVRLAAKPPILPRRLWPSTIAATVVETVLPPAIEGVLSRVDLTQLIINHVSVPRIVDSVDLNAVLEKVDVAGMVEKVVQDVDLPGIVRSSSDTLVTDAVRGVRLQSASADDVVDRLIGHLVPHRRGKAAAGTPTPVTPP